MAFVKHLRNFIAITKRDITFEVTTLGRSLFSKRVTVVSYGAFSHDVMLFQNNEAAAMLVFQANCTGV